MMRDCSKNRAGFDRVLMAVAATFLTVSATSALAQTDPARNSAAELAIDAAIPRPEPANVPPPTVNDFKPDVATTDASAPASSQDNGEARRDQAGRCRCRAAADPGKPDSRQGRHRKVDRQAAPAPTTPPK